LRVLIDKALKHLDRGRNYSIGCDDCIDCIGLLSCWKDKWAEEDIGENVGEGEKK
jgi:hypothetical protein